MKVKLLSYSPDAIRNIYISCRTCYSADGPLKIEVKSEEEMIKLITRVINSGHHSVLEHVSFTFGIEGVSRALTHQLVRHRIASYSQQSQRYVEYSKGKKPNFILPEAIDKDAKAKKIFDKTTESIYQAYLDLLDLGISAEDARSLLPNATETKLTMTMNYREIINVSKIRLCFKAQSEILKMFYEIKKEINKVYPFLAKYIKPKCHYLGYCDEKVPCGNYPQFASRNPLAEI